MIAFEIDSQDVILYAELQPDGEFELRQSMKTAEKLSMAAGVKKLFECIDAGFHRLTVHLEDTIIVFPDRNRDGESYEFEGNKAGFRVNGEFLEALRHVAAFDTLTGTSHHEVLSKEQMKAILTLALLSDECENSAECYKIAEAAIQGWPSEVRPIP